MRKNHLITAFALVALTACSQESPVAPLVADQVKIEPLITRATSTNFEQGDMIGLSIIKGQDVYADNACLSYSEQDQMFSGELKWYAEGGEACSLKAFYPYSETGFPSSFTVAKDQTEGAGSSDFMVATKSNVLPQRQGVSMVFKHYLSQIVVNIENKAGAQIENVELKNLVPTAKIAVEGDVITVTADTEAAVADYTMETVEAGAKYRAIVVPQTVAFSLSVKVEDGAVLVTPIPESELKVGYTYSINVEVTADHVRASIAGEIENWEDGGTLVGGDPVIEFAEYLEDGYFIYNNEKYTVAKLSDGKWWMTQNLHCVPSGVTVSDTPGDGAGVWYPYTTDGTTCTADKSEAAKIAKGYLYDYKTLLASPADISVDNCTTFEGARGICPQGWHIPTRAEFLDFCGYCTKFSEESAAPTNTSAVCWDSEVNYGTVAKANAASWNYTFSGAVANSVYQKTITSEANCSVTDFYGNPAINYYACSTGHVTTGTTPEKMVLLMSTFTKSYSLGRLSTADGMPAKVAVAVRCVRD